MRSTKLLATTGLLGAIALAATGCSSSGGSKASTGGSSSDTTTTSSSAPAPTTSAPVDTSAPVSTSAPAGTAADAATVAAVTKAYTTFFGGTKDPAALLADLQNGPKLSAALAQEATNPTAATLTATVSAVTLLNPHVANVTWTLLSKGAPLLSNTAGQAVLEDGTWKLAAGTFCGLVAASGTVPAACSDTSITAVPSS
jgi:hypothetical protein